MIEFVTFFFGLIAGQQIVEISATEPVALVELHLDGQPVGVPQGPPFEFEIDFGPDLEPHLLEAVGWNGAGEEVSRARQFVNLPRARAELRMVLGGVREDGSRLGRLVWWSASGQRPTRVEVTLDGLPLVLQAQRAFRLPALDDGGEGVRILNAEADFPGGHTAYATTIFGGRYRDRVASELTAVPVWVDDPSMALPSAEAMTGWLRKSGEPLEIFAVDDREGEVIFVRDVGSWDTLRGMGGEFRTGSVAQVGNLGRNTEVRLLDAFPQPLENQPEALQDDRSYALFPLSQPFSPGHGGVPLVVGTYHREHRAELGKRQRHEAEQRLADAVATAGLSVAGSQGARAVVVTLGEDVHDSGQWSPRQVRAFLAKLRVPLHVWSTADPTVREREWGGEEKAWGEFQEASDVPHLLDAVGQLGKDLDRQRLLWIEGQHFLHEITLAPVARDKGLRLVE